MTASFGNTKPALGIVLLLIAAGCVSANVRHLDDVARPARSPDSIVVLLDKPQQHYTVIATIEARGETLFDSFDDLRRKLIAEAALVGGDALIVGPESAEWSFIHHPTALIRSDRKRLNAEVIVFRQPPQ